MLEARSMNADGCDAWIEPSVVPELEPGEIHLWRIPLAGHPDEEIQLQKLLSPEEQAQAGRYHFAHDRRRFIIRRAALRQLLAAYLATQTSIRLESGTHGKPAVAGQNQAGGFRFNCSHSADWVLIATARGIELGVDLEQHQLLSDAAEVAKRCFAEAEIRELAGLPSALKTAGFFNCWTRKEAFIKALGLGLSYPLHSFAVNLSPGQPAELMMVADDPVALKKWTLVSMAVVPDYSAALVFEGNSATIKYFTRHSKLPA